MKLKKGLIISEIDAEYIAVAADEAGKSFSGMMKMNKTAAFISEKLKNETSVDDLVAAVTKEYNVSDELARQSVDSTVSAFRRAKLLEE